MPIINGGKVIINITGAPGAYPDVNNNDIPDKAESLDDGLGNTITITDVQAKTDEQDVVDIVNEMDLTNHPVDGGSFA